MFLGWVERWPQKWDEDGLFSQTTPDVVDSFAPLSQTILKAPYFMDVLSTSPRFFYPLNDPQNSSQSVDATGQNPYAQVQNSWFGYTAGSVGYGASITSTAASLTGGINGYGGPVTGFSNTNTSASGAYNTQNQAQWISLDSAGILGPVAGNYTVSGTTYNGWSRMIAFRSPAAPTYSETLWAWAPSTFAQGSFANNNSGLVIAGSDYGGSVAGNLIFVYGGAGGSSLTLLSGASDGNWHLVLISYETTTNTFNFTIDGGGIGNLTPAQPVTWSPIGSDTIGATVFRGNQFVARPATNVQVAAVAEWPQAIYPGFASPMYNGFHNSLYPCWRNAYIGESSDSRYKRILGWAGYKGLTNIGVGASAMGPATDLIPSNSLGGNLVTSGTDALTALNNVVITENGSHFVDGSGVLVFQPRATRYQPFVAAVTFGENVANGEIPYEDVEMDFDTTQVGNDIQITMNYTQQLFVSEGTGNNPVNNTSQAQYGTRTLQRTVNNTNAQECIDAANYYLYRYGQSDLRVSKLVVHVSALAATIPNIWPICLGLSLGAMVTVKRRPPGWTAANAAITYNAFVESIEWDMTADSATLTMELSPADRCQFWDWAQLHGSLYSPAAAGATSVAINPLPDSATNPARCSFYSGMSICLDPGLSTQETVSVTSVGTTAAGYTSATVNVSALQYAHTAGAVWEDATSGISGVTTTPGALDAYSVVGSTTRWAY